MSSQQQQVTMKDIAERAGVSRATVGFVLSDRPSPVRISDATRRRVLAAAEEMRYRPNTSARAMRSGRFGVVALLLSTVRHRSIVPPQLLDGIHDALAERGLHLVVTKLPDEKLTSAGFAPQILRESVSDGLLISYNTNVPEEFERLLSRHRIPAVWINARRAADCVHPDDLAGMRDATGRLIALGHRRIAYLDYTCSPHFSAFDREAGYRAAMADANLEPRVSRPRSWWEKEERVADVVAMLAGPDRPTAFVTYVHHMVTPVMLAAQRLGLSVPRDLSLVTVDALTTQSFGLGISTVCLPEAAMGAAAVEMLLEKIEDPEAPQAPRVLAPEFTPAETVAPPPPASDRP